MIYADINAEQKLEIENKILEENPNLDKKVVNSKRYSMKGDQLKKYTKT